MKFGYSIKTIILVIALILVVTACAKKIVPVSTEGFTTLPSGLQYKVIEEGTGKKPIEWDIVVVNYEGKLLDGRVFDDTYKDKYAMTFLLSRVIEGWTEGIQLMKVGATYQFIIPPELAYGDGSMGPLVTPNSTLWFQIKLIEIR